MALCSGPSSDGPQALPPHLLSLSFLVEFPLQLGLVLLSTVQWLPTAAAWPLAGVCADRLHAGCRPRGTLAWLSGFRIWAELCVCRPWAQVSGSASVRVQSQVLASLVGCSPPAPFLHLFSRLWPVNLLFFFFCNLRGLGPSRSRGEGHQPSSALVLTIPLVEEHPDSKEHNVCSKPHGDYKLALLSSSPHPCSTPETLQGLQRGKVKVSAQPPTSRMWMGPGVPGPCCLSSLLCLPASLKHPLRT